jgi:uncharacterized membrane protein YfcA
MVFTLTSQDRLPLLTHGWCLDDDRGYIANRSRCANPQGTGKIFLAAIIGFVIAAVSAVLGVAGGEMRIPALMYLFAMPIKAAGTISLLVSIPSVAAGALTYRRLGHVPNRVLLIAIVMASGSLAGVFIGTSLLPLVNTHVLKGILGIILLLATAALALHRNPAK